MHRKLAALLIVPSIVLSNPFETTLQDEIQWLEEETFVVSASRVKENIKKTPASITVIDSDMIEKMGANNILEVLATVPGLGVTQSNIYVKEIESRGIKDWFSQQILFMVDGHSLDANLINGGATWSFSDLKLENIKQIEVIKGPASALYGANAFTGLVNIITKKAEDINGSEVKLKIGSYNTKEVNLLYGEKFEDLSITANINIFKSDGNNVYVPSKNASTDPYKKQLQTNLKLNYKDFYLSSLFNKREDGPHFGPAGGITDESKPKNEYFFIETGLKKDINRKLNINIRGYYDLYKFNNYWELFEESYTTINKITNEKNGIEAIAAYNLNENYTFLIGSMFEKHKQYDSKTIQNYDGNFNILASMTDMSNTSLSFAPKVDRNMKAVYVNNLYDFTENLRFTFGVRYDKYSDFGSNTAPRGGFSWQLNKNNTLKASYGEGFRAPTFEELYNNSVVISGTSNLKSEKVETYELTYENRYNKLENSITYFHNFFSDIITNNNQNADEYITKGIELESKYDLTRGSFIGMNYTYLEAKDDSTNEDLSDVAKHKGNIFFNYRINKYLNSYNHVFLKGKTKRVLGDIRDDVSGYAVFNTVLKVGKLYKNTEFKLTVNNIFDKKYYDPARSGLIEEDYLNNGRNFTFEVKYSF